MIKSNQLKRLMGLTHFNSTLQVLIIALKQFDTLSQTKLIRNTVCLGCNQIQKYLKYSSIMLSEEMPNGKAVMAIFRSLYQEYNGLT